MHAKIGASPGSLIHTGRRFVEATTMVAHDYTVAGATTAGVDHPPMPKEGHKLWLEVTGVHDPKQIGSVGETYDIQPLLLEDIMSTGQRPKFHDGDAGFVSLRMLQWNDGVEEEQVCIWWRPDMLVSFQERPGDCFGPIRERLHRKGTRMQQMPCSYLAYALIDAVVDHTFVVLDQMSERLAQIEEGILEDWQAVPLSGIQIARRELLQVRRAVAPLRELTGGMLRSEQSIDAAVIPFLQDLHDHAIQAIDQIEQQRELVSGLRDLWMNAQATHMNSVMQTLTVVATIFIPLTFMAGIYGMNFVWIPELGWKYGYFALWGAMALVAVGLLRMFRKRGYL